MACLPIALCKQRKLWKLCIGTTIILFVRNSLKGQDFLFLRNATVRMVNIFGELLKHCRWSRPILIHGRNWFVVAYYIVLCCLVGVHKETLLYSVSGLHTATSVVSFYLYTGFLILFQYHICFYLLVCINEWHIEAGKLCFALTVEPLISDLCINDCSGQLTKWTVNCFPLKSALTLSIVNNATLATVPSVLAFWMLFMPH